MLAVLCGFAAFAADDAPTPPKAPPRVPFKAFRIKPILEPKLHDGATSLVRDDADEKAKKTPVRTIRIKPDENPAPTTQIRPAPKPLAPPRDSLVRQSEDVLFAPLQDGPRVIARTQQAQLSGAVTALPPVPPKKPAYSSPDATIETAVTPPAIERIIAEQVAEPPPATTQETPASEADTDNAVTKTPAVIIPLPKPAIRDEDIASSVRIRGRSRFSSDDRTAGMDQGNEIGSLSSLGLPADMRNLNIGKLKQGKGISPVLMPGSTVTKAAPDNKRVDARGIPNEVIVFFQENSADLEVGQLDILNNDVVNMLKSRPDLSIEIVGYAEPQASGPEGTKKLSLSRALMIRQYLIRQRIDADRLEVEGKADKTKIEPRDRVEMYFSR